MYTLPEPQLRRGFPELLGFIFVSCPEELVVYHHERVCRHIVWKYGEVG